MLRCGQNASGRSLRVERDTSCHRRERGREGQYRCDGADQLAAGDDAERAVKHFRVAVACSKIAKKELESMFVESFATVDEAAAAALERYGEEATFLVIPHASDITPVIG